jgi:hypothetical protein
MPPVVRGELPRGRVFEFQAPRFSAYSFLCLNINTIGAPPRVGTRFYFNS